MRDSGGHGGSSYPEVNVPLIFIGKSCAQTNVSYNQIDLPGTLSILFGIPIPTSSIGVLIPNLLTGLSMEQKLYAYNYNGERLLQKLSKIDGAHTYDGEGENIFDDFRSCFFIVILLFIGIFFNFRILRPIQYCQKCT